MAETTITGHEQWTDPAPLLADRANLAVSSLAGMVATITVQVRKVGTTKWFDYFAVTTEKMHPFSVDPGRHHHHDANDAAVGVGWGINI